MKTPASDPAARIPVTVLTGFLGSGKTTLLNRILSEQHGQRIAVIENEFGEIGIDHGLVINADEEVFEMNNGCICCTVRGDLIRILGNLMKRRDRFDRILVETTGMADPGPVAQTFFVDEDMRRQFMLDGVITLVDARHAALHLDDAEEAAAQVAFGDVILINKTDLASGPELDALEARLCAMNPLARILRTRNADVPLEQVLAVGGFDLEGVLARRPDFLAPEYPFEWGGILDLAGGEQLVIGEGPDAGMRIALLPVSAGHGEALQDAAERVLRIWKVEDGLVRNLDLSAPGVKRLPLDAPGPGLHALFTEHGREEFDLRIVDAHDEPVPLLASADFAAGHRHDDTVGSVGIRADGQVDPQAFGPWISELLSTRGNDIFRTKGILNLVGHERRYVIQGVHMLVDGTFDRPWPPGPRENQLVFIGRRLDRGLLEGGFRRCLR
jgi:G3E family GTPase